MVRDLNVVEQRYRAVLEVLDGAPVTEVAERFQVARQTVHRDARWADWKNVTDVCRSVAVKMVL